MQINGVAGVQTRQEYAGNSYDKNIRELKGQIKELQVQMKKIGRDKTLSKEQKEAEQKKLQTQIETLQQQIVIEQQKKQEAKQKEKEASQPSEPQQAPSQAEKTSKTQETQQLSDKAVHGLIKSDMSLKNAERLDQLQISLEGRAHILKREIEWDDQISARTGGALEVNREEYFALEDKIGDVKAAVGEELSELNGSDKENQTETKVNENQQTEKSRQEREDKEQKKAHLDTKA